MAVAALSNLSLTPIFDNNGALVRNARLYFYKPNTLDPVTVYQDQELGAPHPQPIVTGGSGRVPPVYVGTQAYRVRIFDNANQLVEDIPWLPGATESTEGGGGGAGDTAIRTGDTIWTPSMGGVREGWVRLNGGTIGNALSGATERANDDAHDLFVYLWGQDQAALQPVMPSRGASAESDWLANKQLTLLDGAGMVLGGISTMGRPARDTFPGVAMTLGTRDVPGARLGVATHVLTVGQMPQHTHVVNDPGHIHQASQVAHNHGVNDPGHAHSIHDPAHVHGVHDPGHAHSIYDPGHNHSLNNGSHNHDYSRANLSSSRHPNGGSGPYLVDSVTTVNTQTINISANAAATGISIYGSGTGIWLAAAGTGISIYGAATGITTQNAQPAITVGSSASNVTIQHTGSNEAHTNVQPTLLGTFYMKL